MIIKKIFNFFINFINSYFQKSFKNKIIFTTAISLLVPLTVITLLSFTRSSDSMESEFINSNNRSITWAGKYIDKTIEQQNEAIETFLIEQKLFTSMDKTDDSNYKVQFDAKNYVINKMSSLFYSNNKYNGLVFFNESNSQIFYVSDEVKDYKSGYVPSDEIWYSSFTKYPPGTIITDSGFMPKSLDFVNDNKNKSFYVFRRLTEFANNFKGVIFINIKWSIMDDTLDMLRSEKESRIYITDMNGKVIYNPYQSEINNAEITEAVNLIKQDKDSGNSYIKTKDYSIFYYRVNDNNLLTIKIIPNEFIVKAAKSTLKINVLIVIISLIICILVAIGIAYETTKPIRRLSKSMKGIKDIHLVKFTPTGRQDEIGVLEESYAFMIKRIDDLIANEYKIKMEKRTAQLKALQAQINPHFLNNSLQLIGGIAISKNVPEIYTIIKALSNMFSYSIKSGSELVQLKQEIIHIKDYLLIQQLRFNDRINIDLNLDEGLEQYVIPKLIIQPIVENAFRHGLEKKAGLWKLRISAARVDGNINIVVEDNGVGIDKEKLQQINLQLDNNLNSLLEYGQSIGVKNVDARLKMFFGNEYGIKISSDPYQGTRVTMIFPPLSEGEIK